MTDARTALDAVEELRTEEAKLRTAAARLAQLTQENRALARALASAARPPPADAESLQRERREAAVIAEHNAVFVAVLHGLVAESRVDWARDPELCALLQSPDVVESAAAENE